MQCRANTRGVGMRCCCAGLIAFPLPGHSGHGDWQDESSCNHYLHHAKFKWNYVRMIEILTVILCPPPPHVYNTLGQAPPARASRGVTLRLNVC